jgi:hypothetical protein
MGRGKIRMLAVGMMAVGLGVAAAVAASAGTVTPPPGVQELVSQFQLGPNNSRECIDVIDASTSPGAALQIFHCKGTGPRGSAQLFNLLLTRFGTYEILNATSNLCLTGTGSTFTNIRQQTCGGPGSGQQWTLVGDAGSFQIADSETGNTLCMDVEEGSDGGDHTPVILEQCSLNNPRQRFHF